MKLAAVRRKLERVDRAIQKAIDNGELVGASVLARMGDTLEYRAEVGAALTSPERREVGPETRYDLASLTASPPRSGTSPSWAC